MSRFIAIVAVLFVVSLIFFSNSATALNRLIRDCSDPLGNDACYAGTLIFKYNTYFGRREGDPPRGPNPVPGPSFGSTDVDYAYDLVPFIADYYMETFGRDGANDRGGIGDGAIFPHDETHVLVHANGNTALADFNGCDPAGASAGDHFISFCTDSVRADDVFAHEYAHMVVRFRSFNPDDTPNSMVYQSESGALNEHFADLMGEAFEKYRTGSNDWLFGTNWNEPFIRNLSDPPAIQTTHYGIDGPFPDRYHHPCFYCGEVDKGGVHINSTVPSKAAYLFVEGGSFNGWTLAGTEFGAMEQIWYRALVEYWANDETFNGAYLGLRQAARDLYGEHSAELSQLTMALRSVEMDQPGYCSGLPLHRWGDFDQNDQYTLSDSDDLIAAINASSTDLAYDINGDDLVTAADYQVWRGLAAYFTLGPGLSYLASDFDLDGDVDGRDFLLWQRNPVLGSLLDWQANFGRAGLAPTNLAVPEPSSIILLFSLGAACLRRGWLAV